MSLQNFVAGLGDPYALAERQDKAYRQIRGTKDLQILAEEDRQNRISAEQQRQVFRNTPVGDVELAAPGFRPGITVPPAAPAAAPVGKGKALPPDQPAAKGSGRGDLNPPMAWETQPTYPPEGVPLGRPYQDLEGYSPPAGLSGPAQLRRLQEERLRRFANPAQTRVDDTTYRASKNNPPPSSARVPADQTGLGGLPADAVVTPELLAIVRHVESRNNPNAVSPKGARGTMQTMPDTLRAPGFGVRPAQNNTPEEMQRVGEDYLRAMVNRYGDLPTALVAYNWGPGNADKWVAAGADPARLPAETRGYLQQILGAAQATAAAPAPTPGLPVPPTAAAPTATAPTAAAPAAPQTFEQGSFAAMAPQVAQEVQLARMRLSQINQLMQVTRDVGQLQQLNAAAFESRIKVYEGLLFDAATRAQAGDEGALSQLAQEVNIPYAQTPDGFVTVAVDPMTGQGRATSQPMPLDSFAAMLFQRASMVARQSAAAAAQESAKQAAIGNREMAVEQMRQHGQMLRTMFESEAAMQRELAKHGLTLDQVDNVSKQGPMGQEYTVVTRKNGQVYVLQPGGVVDGMESPARLVAVQ